MISNFDSAWIVPPRNVPIWLLLLLPAAVLGCGDSGPAYPTATLSGEVTLDGAPLPSDAEGTITFMPRGSSGQAAPVSAVLVHGRYLVRHAPVGQVVVLLNITRLTGRMVREDNIPTASPHPERENLVPDAWRNGRPINVAGENPALDFDLQTDP